MSETLDEQRKQRRHERLQRWAPYIRWVAGIVLASLVALFAFVKRIDKLEAQNYLPRVEFLDTLSHMTHRQELRDTISSHQMQKVLERLDSLVSRMGRIDRRTCLMAKVPNQLDEC